MKWNISSRFTAATGANGNGITDGTNRALIKTGVETLVLLSTSVVADRVLASDLNLMSALLAGTMSASLFSYNILKRTGADNHIQRIFDMDIPQLGSAPIRRIVREWPKRSVAIKLGLVITVGFYMAAYSCLSPPSTPTNTLNTDDRGRRSSLDRAVTVEKPPGF